MYNVPLCVRRDPGGAARGPGERRRGAVAQPPARPRHPRHTVDPRCCPPAHRYVVNSAVKRSIGSTTSFHNHGEGLLLVESAY